MVEAEMTVGLVVERVAPAGQWANWHWLPVAVLAPAPDTPAWTILATSSDRTRYYAGATTINVYSTEATNYRDNLASGAPKLWVVMRPEGNDPPVEIAAVTADPAEGEAHTEAGNNLVETVDMPLPIAAALSEFVDLHYVERPNIKRKRDKVRPDSSSRGSVISSIKAPKL